MSHLYDTLYVTYCFENCEKKDPMHRLSLCRQARRCSWVRFGQMGAHHAQYAGDPRAG